jgi:pimeloyl-ACP methyl ester carboxylesterase
MLGENRSGQGAILVGHSMGGPVAARVAMDFPDRVSGLVLLSSSVDPDLEETKWFQIPAEWLLLKWLVPRDLKVCNEEILALRGELNKLRPEWEKLDVPVAVVHGELDDLVPVGNVDFLKRHLKSSSLVDLEILPGMNHFVPWERSDAVLNAIRLVSEKVPPGP